jgi:glutamyl-tRNA reductase
MESLTELHVCARRTVSLAACDIARLQAEAAAAHPGAAMVASCQRLEAFSLAPCECKGTTQYAGLAALARLASVAAGLDSVVLGESQIMGQVRTAFAETSDQLRALADVAIASARELRRETEFASHAGHLLDRALKLAAIEPGGRMLVLGTGAMGRLVAQRGVDLGFTDVVIAGRTAPRDPGPWSFVPLKSVRSLEAVDILAGCLGSGAGEFAFSELPRVREVAIDLGTPRNFTPNESARLITIADMLADEEARPHARKRRAELRSRLDELLERRIADATDTGRSPVGALRARVEGVRQRELARMRRLHPEISPDTLDVLTRSLVNQIFHGPSQRLKQMDDQRLSAELAALFTPAG